MKTKQASIKNYLFLHIILLFYSIIGIVSKLAAQTTLFSTDFLLYYFLVLFSLFLYAILWQQVLKSMPLSTAFSNKAVITVWGMLWGCLFFKEEITLQMIIGAVIIFVGVYLVVTDHE